jgi:8-oxo-dGTP pyrophosphatase MutT (NUDIX family)
MSDAPVFDSSTSDSSTSDSSAKVFAYITHQNRLLVFSHPDFSAAGIQVPAGTVESGETLQAAIAILNES